MAKGVIPTPDEGRHLAALVRERKEKIQNTIDGGLPPHPHLKPRTYIGKVLDSIGPRYYENGAWWFLSGRVELHRVSKHTVDGLPIGSLQQVMDQNNNTPVVKNAYNMCNHWLRPFPWHGHQTGTCGELFVFCTEDAWGNLCITQTCDPCQGEGSSSCSSTDCDTVCSVIVGKGNLRRVGDCIYEDKIKISIKDNMLCVEEAGVAKVYICCDSSASDFGSCPDISAE